MTANAHEVTISDINQFSQCRQLFDYSSMFRQGLQRKRRGPHFAVGTAAHAALEQYYLGQRFPQRSFDDFVDENIEIDVTSGDYTDKLLEQIEATSEVLRVYPAWAETVDNFTVVNTEQRSQIRLNDTVPGLFFSFRYDLLAERDGEYWLMDFKTTKQLPNNADWLLTDNQAVAYQWAAEEAFNVPIAGILYTYLRKKKPTVPKLKVRGGMSKIASHITTVETYQNALDEHGLDHADYADHLTHIANNLGNWFFRRFEVRASARQKALHRERVLQIATEMINPDVFIYPSPNRMKCVACDFKQPCELQQMWLSTKALLSVEYEAREPRE